jgi:hexokinase
MALQAATQKVVKEFTLLDEDLQKIVKEFIWEMSKSQIDLQSEEWY